MLTDRQVDNMLGKLRRFESTLDKLLFKKIDSIDLKAFPTDGSHNSVPDKSNFKECNRGDSWTGEGSYCWFRGEYTVPSEFEGQTLFIWPQISAYEGFLFVNGRAFGNFSTKINHHSHGNHYCDMLKSEVKGNEVIDIALEYYANHYIIGTQPFEEEANKDFTIRYNGVDICVKNEAIWDPYFNLKIVNQMAQYLGKDDFVRAKVVNALKEVHQILYYDYENVDHDTFMETLAQANEVLKAVLKDTNSVTTPYAGLVGHSHMDTAWLWHRGETLKKCARTYSNQMSLMEQYDEYTFIQSSTHHLDLMKKNYPELFEEIKEQIAKGKYEPNGGVFIECDCNIPSGEYMVRQFLWGQRFTREHFNYTSDSFWLPDTFGYSVSLPQIMKGCDVKYFLTTKMDWNDTNQFPYDSFYWKGLDGTKVLTHLNRLHLTPDPKMLIENTKQEHIREKSVSNMRLLSYGFGDGGGGPEFEQIEIANRLKDVEGLPRSGHTTATEFMNRLEDTIVDPSVYSGELYLELHRGTLTNQHQIKRNNRIAEIALRSLEYITVRNAVKNGEVASDEVTHPLMEVMLINQFHDILPGTCVASAHDQSLAETSKLIADTNALVQENIAKVEQQLTVSLLNTLSFERADVVYIDYLDGYVVEGDYKQQVITDIHGNRKLAIYGIVIPAFSSVVLKLVAGTASTESVFTYDGNKLDAPLVKVVFNDRGFMESYVDKRVNREVRGEGYALNTFLVAEDVPNAWDNWDVDVDIEYKYKDAAKLLSREVVSNGPVELRIRSKYQLTEKTTILQDTVFYAHSAEVKFDTIMDWNDHHRFLKAAFDTNILTDFARQEIQFGYIKRTTSRNTSEDKAKFEVSNHKYSDLSENRYGVALLNDCKYGISVKDSQMRLSLHKGGNRPDARGDMGLHECSYSFYPHDEAFGANTVIKPAYEFNYKPIVVVGEVVVDEFVKVSADNIIIESIKPLEDNERGYIIRLYEAEGTYTRSNISFADAVTGLALTNMLEEVQEDLGASQVAELSFKAFEIKTLKVNY